MPLSLCVTTLLPVRVPGQPHIDVLAHWRRTAIERSSIATAENDMIAAIEIA